MATKKKATDIVRKRRLQKIQNIHEQILKGEKLSRFSRLDKVAYILWRYPNTRNSDRTHAIQYYKTFDPEYVEGDKITFENLYKITKMYDLQRDRATIQNTEELFPAKTEIKKKRAEKASEYKTYYVNSNPKNFINDLEYFVYLDESGKNDKYFILAGILINSEDNKTFLENKLIKLREKLNKKYNLEINEWKFSNINHNNESYYKDLIKEIKAFGINITFVSIILENNGLSGNSKRYKTKKLLKFIVKDCLDTLTLYTCRSSYEGNVSYLNVILDNDGAGLDELEKEQIKTDLEISIGVESKYFSELKYLNWEDSTNNNFIQLADLYASSLNNIFSEKEISGKNSQSKKDFAKEMIEAVGIQKAFDSRGNNTNFEFINKCIYKEDIPSEFKEEK